MTHNIYFGINGQGIVVEINLTRGTVDAYQFDQGRIKKTEAPQMACMFTMCYTPQQIARINSAVKSQTDLHLKSAGTMVVVTKAVDLGSMLSAL